MTDGEQARWETGLEEYFETRVLPELFGGIHREPRFELVAADSAGATRRWVERSSATDGVATVDIHRARSLAQDASAKVGSPLSGVDDLATRWLRDILGYARQSRNGLRLAGTFTNPDNAVATVRRFADAGFTTGVNIVATARVDDLLADVASQAQNPDPEWQAARDHGNDATANLARALEREADTEVTVIGRGGNTWTSTTTGNTLAYGLISEAVIHEQSRTMTTLEAVRWLSRLRRLTELPDRRIQALRIAEPLIELHALGMREVLPALSVPAGSGVIEVADHRFARELIRLRTIAEPSKRDVAPAAATASPPPVSRNVGLE